MMDKSKSNATMDGNDRVTAVDNGYQGTIILCICILSDVKRFFFKYEMHSC